jgi:type I restriction enzyme M protein
MVRGDVVEVMVALPDKLFLNTGIPVCLWFLTNDKTMSGRDRRGETLFIDARQLGTMETRVLKVFTDEDIAKIADTVQAWKTGAEYEDIAGFCKSASLEEIEKNGFVLTPGRYVGAELDADDGSNFEDRLINLTENLSSLMETSKSLDHKIREQLMELMTDDR